MGSHIDNITLSYMRFLGTVCYNKCRTKGYGSNKGVYDALKTHRNTECT